jgi:hypothetical protein
MKELSQENSIRKVDHDREIKLWEENERKMRALKKKRSRRRGI